MDGTLLRRHILAKLASGSIRAVYAMQARKPELDDARRLCMACDEALGTRLAGIAGVVEYRLVDGISHFFHLRCDSVRLVVAADQIWRQIRQRGLSPDDDSQ